ncbi:alpha/beta fold hydrolase [Aquipseudomonas guryensis]|uniref:Alpha/beta hydrolase n=1 Tax=Aquipseudomonas guryensis TaxID=2759165 RepID=A0A7W4DEG3_9GAMM|nr:alpha/beta hydrolase [Pseudomonas guryensis]MBB1521053.1 alpha/beta hydrolase [Pseudomonas guryensis]
MNQASALPPTVVRHRYAEVDGVHIFYREAGQPELPTLLLLHGFPSSSHQFRHLLPLLAEHFHVVAPDFPGFGFTQVPAERGYVYSFEQIAGTLAAFTCALGLQRYALYLFDYGAPVGLRLALLQPQRITGLVSQNGNAYEEGLSEAWAPVRAYWSDPSPANRQAIRDGLLSADATRWQYLAGVPDPELIAPEAIMLDSSLLERPGNKDIQLDLILDYANNIDQYPAFQAWLRQGSFPVLVIWGRNDPFFLPSGAEAFARDVPHAVVELLETGHFALETHCQPIAARIRAVLGQSASARGQ